MKRGLADSRWASPRPTSTPTSKPNNTTTTTTATIAVTVTHSTPAPHAPEPKHATPIVNGTPPRPGTSLASHELARYTKIVRRLKWKLPFLAAGYRQAVSREEDPVRAAEAELMFKLDFFEYYMLLERALVHLLGVFGITISRDFAERHLAALSQHAETLRGGGDLAKASPNGSGAVTPRFSHRYHANVLEALESKGNPLYLVLGTGDVRRQLGRAKDLRNRWKNADADVGDGKPATLPLESYDLERILTVIFDGFDLAFAIAEQSVASAIAPKSWDTEMEDEIDKDGTSAAAVEDDGDWGFMVDAMDWEAV